MVGFVGYGVGRRMDNGRGKKETVAVGEEKRGLKEYNGHCLFVCCKHIQYQDINVCQINFFLLVEDYPCFCSG